MGAEYIRVFPLKEILHDRRLDLIRNLSKELIEVVRLHEACAYHAADDPVKDPVFCGASMDPQVFPDDGVDLLCECSLILAASDLDE